MKCFSAQNAAPTLIVEELLHGGGAVKITGLFSDAEISAARAAIMLHSETAREKVTHFQGDAAHQGKLNLQRRVWNLLSKGDVFSTMATQPTIMAILREFLGSAFIMGSIAANRILPGGPGQEPHIDYPYWDLHKPDTHPRGINSSFPLNAQLTILLDRFTAQSGATAYVPGSQRALRYPNKDDQFFERCERMLGEPGDVVLFFGATWHCAMPNKSENERNAVLVQYLPKWVKPMEDMPTALTDAFIASASAEIKQLIGLDYPYPEVLDAAKAGNTEGVA